jgi:hypothetical protein
MLSMFFKKRKRHTDSAVAPASAEQPQVPQEIEQLPFEKPTPDEPVEQKATIDNEDNEELEPTISDQELAEFMSASSEELESAADEFVKHMVNSGNDRALIHRVLDSSRFSYEREKAFQGLLGMMKNPAADSMMSPVTFSGAQMPGESLAGMQLNGPQSNLKLLGTIRNVVFSLADLTHADFSQANIESLALVGCDAEGLKINFDSISSIIPGYTFISLGGEDYKVVTYIFNAENSPELQKKFSIPEEIIANIKNRG